MHSHQWSGREDGAHITINSVLVAQESEQAGVNFKPEASEPVSIA